MDFRLVPYIKKYLHEGHSLGQIRRSLLNQGVPDSDIKQAAVYAMDEGVKEIKKNSTLLWIIPVILILIIAGVGYYFQNEIISYAKDTIEKSIATSPNKSIEQSVQQNIQPNQATEPCDMNCLISAAQNCQSANAEFSSQQDFFGMIITSTNNYEIIPGNECKLHIKNLDGDIEFSQELQDQSLANGISQNDLNTQLEESKKSAKSKIGKEGTCVFTDNNRLKEFLEKTYAGTFSGSISCPQDTTQCTFDGDWSLGDCTGNLFSN